MCVSAPPLPSGVAIHWLSAAWCSTTPTLRCSALAYSADWMFRRLALCCSGVPTPQHPTARFAFQVLGLRLLSRSGPRCSATFGALLKRPATPTSSRPGAHPLRRSAALVHLTTSSCARPPLSSPASVSAPPTLTPPPFLHSATLSCARPLQRSTLDGLLRWASCYDRPLLGCVGPRPLRSSAASIL